jgi:hypothetical protein
MEFKFSFFCQDVLLQEYEMCLTFTGSEIPYCGEVCLVSQIASPFYLHIWELVCKHNDM